jgi:hypothetical protein
MDSQRVLEIILEETAKAEARYPSYRNDLKEVVAEIVDIERQHKIVSRNVKQDIAAQINTIGTELAKHVNK